MTPEGRLARAHEELAACATSGDRGRHADAVGAVVEALVCFDDMVGAFECSEELVDGWTARLAGPDPTASRRTLLYLELVEQVYAAVNVELAVFITRGRRADLLAESGRQQESEELLRELVAHADSAPVEVYGGDAHRALALLLAERGEHVEALALLDRAVDRARRAGDGESLAASLSARSDVLDLQGRPDEAQADVDELLGALLTSVEEEVDPQLVQAHRRLADAVAARDDGAFQEATGRIADLVEAGGQPTALALLELVRVRLDALLPEPSEPPDDDGRRQCSRYARAVERLFPWLDDELAGVDLEAPVAGALDVAGAVHAQLGEDDAAARCFEAAGRRWGALSADDLAQDSAQAAADVWLRIAYRSFSDQPAHEAASRRAYELARTTSRGGCLSMAATGLAHALSRRSAYDEAVAVLGPQLAVVAATAPPDVAAHAHLILCAAYVCLGDAPRAEATARAGLRLAQRSGADADLVEPLRAVLGTTAAQRGDTDAAQALLAGVFDENALELQRDQTRWRDSILAGDDQAALAQALAMANRLADQSDPDALLALVLARMLLAEQAGQDGDHQAADEHRATAEDALDRVEAAVGATSELWRRFYAVLLRALLAAAGGRPSQALGLLERLHDEALAAGLGTMAGQVLHVLGMLRRTTGEEEPHLEDFLVAALVARARLADLPSSAERETYRPALALVTGSAVEAVYEAGDARLLSELVETLRAQSLPTPDDADVLAAPPVVALLAAFRPDGEPGGRPTWAEQVSRVAIPPRVVMPWGRPALEPFHETAVRYVPALALAPRVPLEVPR